MSRADAGRPPRSPDVAAMRQGPIKALLVDDQTLVRQGIRSLLALSDDVEVIAEAEDGAAALELLDGGHVSGDVDDGGTQGGTPDRPDVVLLDLRMPGMGGIATLEALRERGIDVPVLVLTTFDDAELVLGALQAGARGYMLKDVTLEQLVGGIRTVADGGTLLQPALTDRLLRASAKAGGLAGYPGEPGMPVESLTARETDVLRLAAGGYSNKEIAAMLHLAEGTVKNHISTVLLKLGARDRTQAVLRGLHLGLLSH